MRSKKIKSISELTKILENKKEQSTKQNSKSK